MKVLTKKVIAAYAEAILDIMEHNPSKDNTKNILETIEIIYEEWDGQYATPDPKEFDSALDYFEISRVLDDLKSIARNYVEADDYLDFDCDEMVGGLMSLVKFGNQNK